MFSTLAQLFVGQKIVDRHPRRVARIARGKLLARAARSAPRAQLHHQIRGQGDQLPWHFHHFGARHRQSQSSPPAVFPAFRSPEFARAGDYFGISRRSSRRHRSASDAPALRRASGEYARSPAAWRHANHRFEAQQALYSCSETAAHMSYAVAPRKGSRCGTIRLLDSFSARAPRQSCKEDFGPISSPLYPFRT